MERSDFNYMQTAYNMARKAAAEDEVPVGAVIIHDNTIIAKAFNQIESLKDPTAHAEMIAITQASSYLESKVLNDTEIFVTLEPCPMCSMAIVLAKIKRLVFAAKDPRTGAAGSVYNIVQDKSLNHQVIVEQGLMKLECSALLKDFFKERRGGG
ncbi:tRNA adenosine(34) deaminase TadA [Planctomycetota bacterium]